ncbi:chaplin [Streptomyces sp. NPDC050564]|uniref:chaplin n=1 Tax=unclassified Streptomyces TaxID=2593676 RepID=UPI0037A41F05|nr:chaplin [Streptomyces sp. NBC_00996]
MRIRLMAAAGLASVALLAAAGAAAADPDPVGAAVGSPGVLSGNVIQVPVDLGLNLCGNSIDVLSLLNPAFGNSCVND